MKKCQRATCLGMTHRSKWELSKGKCECCCYRKSVEMLTPLFRVDSPRKTIAQATQSTWDTAWVFFLFCFNKKYKIQLCTYYSGIGGGNQAGAECSNPFWAVPGGKKAAKAETWRSPVKGLLVWNCLSSEGHTLAVLVTLALLYRFLSPAKHTRPRDWCFRDVPPRV